MYVLVRGAFSVSFEWGRLVHIVLLIGAFAVLGNALLPTHGAIGLLTRAAVFAAIPPALLATGFAHREELSHARSLLHRARSSWSRA
jgi:hypothetical protein